MPFYEYACPACPAVATHFRQMAKRRQRTRCPACGAYMALQISRPHVAPDGVYSYAPNLGSEAAFERKRAAIQETRETGRVKVIPKEA